MKKIMQPMKMQNTILKIKSKLRRMADSIVFDFGANVKYAQLVGRSMIRGVTDM